MRKVTDRSRARARSEADTSRRKSSTRIASATFSAVSTRTPGRAFSTRSTVASDTPALRATSCTVARRFKSSMPRPPWGAQLRAAGISSTVWLPSSCGCGYTVHPIEWAWVEPEKSAAFLGPHLPDRGRCGMTVSVERFGVFEGSEVEQFKLVSETGVEVDIISWGVAVRDWRVPVGDTKRSVVLGFDTFDSYPTDSPSFGSLAGRVANRIAGASFELDGTTYSTPPNFAGRHTLHGGPQGLGRVVWRGETDNMNNAVRFTHVSPDGHAGFPGTVAFTATYTLTGNRLRLDLHAKTDKRTPINVVQHQYFNLGTTPDVLDHVFQINANAYTELDAALLPTGVIRPVAGTKFDFRTPRTLRDSAGKAVPYDINLVLDQTRNQADPVATVKSPDGALTLRLWTDRPGVQLYDGVYTDTAVPGLGGKPYKNYSGFCLEDQSFPDAVHHPHFPSIIHSPERPYAHFSEVEIA